MPDSPSRCRRLAQQSETTLSPSICPFGKSSFGPVTGIPSIINYLLGFIGFIGLVWNPSKFINQPMGIWDIYGHHSLKQIWAISPWTSLVYPLVVCTIASWKQQPLVRWFPTTLTFTDSFGISQPARFEDRGQSSIFHQYPIHRLHEIPHYPPWYSL